MKWLSFVVQYLPTILQGVIAVQGAVTGPGLSKKQILIGALKAGAGTAEQIPVAHIDGIGRLIDSVVTGLKDSGLHGFSNDPAAVSTDPAAAAK